MEVKQIVNSVFTSNTYIVSENNSASVWLIDVGDIDGVLHSLTKEKFIKGVFITHTHFDHIYGINKLIDTFPDCIVYTSEDGKKGLFSDKLNLSYYHNDPVNFLGSNIQILTEGDKIEIFESFFLETMETPGHNWGCLTYRIGNYLFTGDSYIPNVPVVTKLKGGDRVANKKSLLKIMDNISMNTIICPGHGLMTNP
jgi:glyoxylase-like metal-dependent hydrolase (beta-lactamase superfamily II)